jgi:hypothetical protein
VNHICHGKTSPPSGLHITRSKLEHGYRHSFLFSSSHVFSLELPSAFSFLIRLIYCRSSFLAVGGPPHSFVALLFLSVSHTLCHFLFFLFIGLPLALPSTLCCQCFGDAHHFCTCEYLSIRVVILAFLGANERKTTTTALKTCVIDVDCTLLGGAFIVFSFLWLFLCSLSFFCSRHSGKGGHWN